MKLMGAKRSHKDPPTGGGEPAGERPACRIEPGTVHLWIADLPPAGAQMEACEAVLSSEERVRAAQRRLARDRTGFVAVRGILRRLLGMYCGLAPDGLCFGYGLTGKPFLRDAPFPLGFNVSHAGGLALLAFARGAEVGVDVERLRPVARADRIAARVMTAERATDWRLLPPDERGVEFMREWTRLEAFSKLTGEGVWKTLIAGRSGAEADATWFQVDPAPGYVAALAVGARHVRLLTRRWPAEVNVS
jgi:4'-phosphopantetheinyl transferase